MPSVVTTCMDPNAGMPRADARRGGHDRRQCRKRHRVRRHRERRDLGRRRERPDLRRRRRGRRPAADRHHAPARSCCDRRALVRVDVDRHLRVRRRRGRPDPLARRRRRDHRRPGRRPAPRRRRLGRHHRRQHRPGSTALQLGTGPTIAANAGAGRLATRATLDRRRPATTRSQATTRSPPADQLDAQPALPASSRPNDLGRDVNALDRRASGRSSTRTATRSRHRRAPRPVRPLSHRGRSAIDNIAGGADNDVVFGQLGNDTLQQGDGSTSRRHGRDDRRRPRRRACLWRITPGSARTVATTSRATAGRRRHDLRRPRAGRPDRRLVRASTA